MVQQVASYFRHVGLDFRYMALDILSDAVMNFTDVAFNVSPKTKHKSN